jgi:hypothetical protein
MIEKDVGAYFVCAQALDNAVATAGGAGDNTPVNGTTFDRRALSDPGLSAALLLAFRAVLAAAQTVSVTIQFQDSADGSAWANYGAAQVFTVGSAGAGGAQDIRSVVKADMGVNGEFGLDGARRFVRVVHTPNLTAGATDTFTSAGLFAVGGLQEKPGTGRSITA